jgi:ribosome-associated protein
VASIRYNPPVRTIPVPVEEVEFRTSRSGGPGGQNVNKVETRVEARWSVETSPSLSEQERDRLRAALGRRLTAGGVLRATSQRYRTQAANRSAALERLREIVRVALTPRRARKKTAPSGAAHETRLAEKRLRARLKRDRALGRSGGRRGDD